MANTRPRTLRIPPKLEEELRKEFEQHGQSFSAGVVQLLTEAMKARRVPGIYFRDTPTNRREAVIGGTGLAVWEVFTIRKSLESDEQLPQACDFLSAHQLRQAITYHKLFPEEIDAQVDLNDSWTPEKVREMYPELNVTDTVVDLNEPANAA